MSINIDSLLAGILPACNAKGILGETEASADTRASVGPDVSPDVKTTQNLDVPKADQVKPKDTTHKSLKLKSKLPQATQLEALDQAGKAFEQARASASTYCENLRSFRQKPLQPDRLVLPIKSTVVNTKVKTSSKLEQEKPVKKQRAPRAKRAPRKPGAPLLQPPVQLPDVPAHARKLATLGKLECKRIQKEFFWERVEKIDDCWIWVGRNSTGCYYGTKQYTPQALAWKFASKPALAINQCLRSTCGNRYCINPDHRQIAKLSEGIVTRRRETNLRQIKQLKEKAQLKEQQQKLLSPTESIDLMDVEYIEDKNRLRYAKLLRKATRDPATNCLVTANRSVSTIHNGQAIRLGRLIYILATGNQLAGNQRVTHTCGNDRCLNIEHIRISKPVRAKVQAQAQVSPPQVLPPSEPTSKEVEKIAPEVLFKEIRNKLRTLPDELKLKLIREIL